MDAFNVQTTQRHLFIATRQPAMDEDTSQDYFAFIKAVGDSISAAHTTADVRDRLLLRGIAYAALQNFSSAIEDFSIYLTIDSTSALAYWQRAVCQSKLNDFQASQSKNTDMTWANVFSDLSRAISMAPQSAFLYYNRGNLYVQRKDYASAIADYSRAIELDPAMPEAYYNRGLARVESQQTAEGVDDLSKAGELGLYTAYSLIKKYRK